MPCVNSNGQPVPGAQGMCPIGSTWRHPNGAEIEAMKVHDLPKGSYGRDDEGTSTGELTPGWFGRNRMSDEDISKINLETSMEGMMNRQPLMDTSGWPDWAVDAGIVGAGFLGGGRGGNKQAMMQSIKNLSNKLFKKKTPQKTKAGDPKYELDMSQPIYKNIKPNWNKQANGGKGQWEFRGNKINPAKWNNGKGMNSSKKVRIGFKPKLDAKGNPIPQTKLDWSKLKIGGWGLGGLSLQQLMSNMGGEPEKPVSKVDTDPSSPTYKGGREARAGRGPTPEPTNMEKFGKNLKDPKWWMENMGGGKTDTRLMKLGQLMDYYGKTPKGRAASDSPAKLWAANAAAAAKGSSSSYAALKNMILSPKELADSIFIDGGGTFGIQAWGGMDDDQRKAEAQKMGNSINALMHELAMAGQLPTWENAASLYYARNPDKDPRNKSTKPDEDEEKSWWDFTST